VGDEVIVVRKATPDHAILINRQDQLASACQVEERPCTGVPVTARFLTQHFWEPSSVAALRNLALLTLDYAAHERPTEIGNGFDLMTLVRGTVTWERYTPNDRRIEDVRCAFSRGVQQLIFQTPFRARAD
jgi:hypothetical protein